MTAGPGNSVSEELNWRIISTTAAVPVKSHGPKLSDKCRQTLAKTSLAAVRAAVMMHARRGVRALSEAERDLMAGGDLCVSSVSA